MELFPNLYRPPTSSHSSVTAAQAQESLGRVRVQTTVPGIIRSLEPGAMTSVCYPRQATIAGSSRRAVTSTVTRPSPLSLVRTSPYPSFNQRQTYFGCCRGRSSRTSQPNPGKTLSLEGKDQ